LRQSVVERGRRAEESRKANKLAIASGEDKYRSERESFKRNDKHE
jgi:hypothetical protein